MRNVDFLIVGAGVVGLSVARVLKKTFVDSSVLVLDKEQQLAFHASGRNSGVLHAGFYYGEDSLKARFCVEGNEAWRNFCHEHSLPINECGKLVVAKNEHERQQLHELQRRGDRNGCSVELVTAEDAKSIEPYVRTFEQALFSPKTATVDPLACMKALGEEFRRMKGEIELGAEVIQAGSNEVRLSTNERIGFGVLVNCAGLYADTIATEYGLAANYTLLPFKGLYLKHRESTPQLRTNIYPVPDLEMPFLGVHFTVTADGQTKIGPTAVPAFWRENYQGISRFRLSEFVRIALHEANLFARNSFRFRSHALEEMKKYYRPYFVGQAMNLVDGMDPKGFDVWSKPGIRAQLLDTRTGQLVQDFVVESQKNSIHVLNAVSPAFTCAFPFAEYLVQEYCSGATKGALSQGEENGCLERANHATH